MGKKRKKKRTIPGKSHIRLSLLLSIGFILVLLSPWLIWLSRPTLPLSVLVYNKTVPDTSAKAHVGLGWLLHHFKLHDISGDPFSATTTYRGYHPGESEENRIVPLGPVPEDMDLVYIADTYGIYRNGEGFSRSDHEEGTRNLIYGGMDQTDVDTLREFLNRDNPNTVVAEYNTFATPTPDYIQSQLYEMFRATWTGWSGQFVADLSTSGDTPSWIYGIYEQQSGEAWNYTGSGIVIYNTNDEILVLVVGEDLGPNVNQFVYTPAGERTLRLSGSTYYTHLFDIVEPLAGAEVLGEYQLDTTPQGARKLKDFGLETTFPAIIRGTTASHSTYYLAGNWAYSPTPLKFSFLAGVPNLMRRTVQNSLDSENNFYWHIYLPLMQSIFDEAYMRKSFPPGKATATTTSIGQTTMVSRTHGNLLQVWQDEQWKDLFIHGINLGIAMPGKWFTDFPKDKALYYRWLTQFGELGANTLRIYTLLDPEFYHAFLLYNQLHPEQPMWLMQEIWPEEEPHGNDYLDIDYQEEYQKEIVHVIDAVHGNATIAERRGRAWGTYTSDVSAYIVGYLVGRELEPHEVEDTDLLNEGYLFNGDYIRTTAAASPTEAWLAESTDYVLGYEESAYGWQHPVAIVNWPTLDPIEHPSERNEKGEKVNESNDRTTVDINNLLPGPQLKAGLFGAYHIYPNYPDFMNNDPLYDTYEDEFGRFRYGGYLKEFMEHHTAYPAVIAEFGLATGMGNAHFSPDGYHHGSMTELQQGEGIIRMFEAMRTEGYAGGIIFEWMDEWTKKTWTTEPYMVPYDRHILWHNAVDPEQNYGILAYEAIKPKRAAVASSGAGAITHVELRLDASFLHIDMGFTGALDFSKERLLIGLDTFGRELGELLYDKNLTISAPSGMEYLVVIDGKETSRLLAIPPANGSQYKFSTYEGLEMRGLFESMRKLTNKARALQDGTPIPARYEDASKLHQGKLIGSTNHWKIEGNTLSLRIPWTRINVSDPSSGTVLDDKRIFYTDPLRDVLHTTTSDGIAVSAALVQNKTDRVLGTFPAPAMGVEPVVLAWQPWNQPTFRERLKESYTQLQDYFITFKEN